MSGIELLVAHIESLPIRVREGDGSPSSSIAAPSLNEDSVWWQLDKLTRLYSEAFGSESEYVARLNEIRPRVERILQKIAAIPEAPPPTPKRSTRAAAAKNSDEMAGMPFFYRVSRKFWRPNTELSDLWFFKLPHKVCNFCF